MSQQPSTPPAPSAPFLTTDAETAVQHFTPIVAHYGLDELAPWKGDAEIIRVNVTHALDELLAHHDVVRQRLPYLPLHEVEEMRPLSLALIHLADKVFVPASKGEIRIRQQRLRPLREQTLGQLEIFAARGMVSADAVKNIRAGTGPFDEARDAVAIVALFHFHQADLTHKHPFTEAELHTLAADGNWLLVQLNPPGATPGSKERTPDMLLRDRFYTALVRRYDDLYKAGVEVWGRLHVNEHVPALLARAAAPRASAGTAPNTGPPSQ